MIGIHTSLNNIKNAISLSKKYGLQYIQFIAEDYKYDYSSINFYNIKPILHASYYINSAKSVDPHSFNIIQTKRDINIVNKINAYAYIIHLGKQTDLSYKNAYNNMKMYIKYILMTIKNSYVLIETSSGQGTEMCFNINELSKLFNELKQEYKTNKLGICIDTCHLYAAGYNINDDLMNKLDKLIGKKYIKLIHLNDSRGGLGERKDRHESIGKGYIGTSLYDFGKKLYGKIPIILETPEKHQIEEIKKLI